MTALPPQVSYRGAWLIPADVYLDRQQTPSGTDLRHPSFLQRERCRKAMLGVWTGSKLQASIYDIISPKRTVPESDAGSVERQQTPSTDLRHPFSKEDGAGKRCWECGPAANSKHRFTTSFLQRGRCRKAMLGVWTGSKLQASIYDIISPKRTVPESDAGSVERQQTPSTDLRHPFSKEDGAGKRCWECGTAANSKHRFTTSFLQRGRCRKAMLGVWTGSKLQAPIYDILSPKRTVPESDAGSVDRQQTPSIDLRHPFSKEDGAGKRCWECGPAANSKHRFTTSFLQRGRCGKRCWECGPAANSKHRFTTSFLQRGRCRKAMLGVWTGSKLQASIYDILSPKRTVPESDAGNVDRQHCFRIFELVY